MPIFSYIAIDKNGLTKSSATDQPDRAKAIEAISALGLRPISIKEAKAKAPKYNLGNFFGNNKVKTSELVIFTRQLSAMVGAGVPLLRALSALSGHAPDSSPLKKMLISVIHDVEAGSMLSDALAKFPATFNSVYTNMVRAGEAAGILDDILKRLAIQQEKSSTMKKKIKSAMAYPTVLIVVTILAFFGLMIFIIPKIGESITALSGGDGKLPAITEVMLKISGFVTSYWLILIPGLIFAILGTLFYIKTPTGKSQFDRLILKIPVINKVIMKIAIAHFARTFSALIEAGVAVLEALTVTSHAVGSTVYEKALLAAEEEVKNGKNLSKVIEANPLFPPIVAQMLSVGEETGQTDKVLVKVAEFYEEEVDIAIDGLSTIIEPVMIVVIGGMVGLVAISVMLPIAQMSTSIK